MALTLRRRHRAQIATAFLSLPPFDDPSCAPFLICLRLRAVGVLRRLIRSKRLCVCAQQILRATNLV
jgi:hypothetical protein